MALFRGEYSNDMRYITFKYPLDVNITQSATASFKHTFIDILAKVKHLHNFNTVAEEECRFN